VSSLLEVALDHGGVARRGFVGILTELPPGPPLAQQVPALVEPDLQIGQPAGILVRQGATSRGVLPQLVLLLDEAVDALEDLGIVHGRSPYRRS